MHSNLLALVENAALKSQHYFRVQDDLVASIPHCFSGYLSLEREL